MQLSRRASLRQRAGAPIGREPARPGGGPQRAGTKARVSLLGGFAVWEDGRPVRLTVHAQQLIALALNDSPLPRADGAERLWLDGSQDHATYCLRSTLWRMHTLPRPVLDVSATHLAIDAYVAVDVREFEESSEQVPHGGMPAAIDLDCVVHGDDLPLDWYEDWMVDERDRLGQIRPALETACAKLVAAGRTTDAIVVGIAAVASVPLRDRATRALIPAYDSGRSLAAALRRFETYRAALAAALQRDPSPQMLELVRSLAPVVA